MLNSILGPNISAISPKLDQELLPAVMVLLHQKLKTKTTNENWDIYTESNLFEARRILPVLDALRLRLDDLLVQWPEHVTLLQVRIIFFVKFRC